MIITPYTVITLFIAVLTGIIAVILFVSSSRVYLGLDGGASDTGRTEAENRSYLLLLLAKVVLYAKLLSWPLLYVTLQSYVPYLPGSMCIFGVTQAQPALSGVIQILKPLSFLLIGGWLLLNRLDRTTETAPLFRRKILFLSLVSILVAAESGAEVAYLVGFESQADVGCCTTVFDLPDRKTALLSSSILGEGYGPYLLPLYYLSNLTLVGLLGLAYRRLSGPGGRAAGVLGAAAVFSLLNSAVTAVAAFEKIAPEVMDLPYHHCIYCMWQYAPDSALATAFAIIGNFSPLWAVLIMLTGRHPETSGHLQRYAANLCFLGIITTGASLAMVTVHLLF